MAAITTQGKFLIVDSQLTSVSDNSRKYGKDTYIPSLLNMDAVTAFSLPTASRDYGKDTYVPSLRIETTPFAYFYWK